VAGLLLRRCVERQRPAPGPGARPTVRLALVTGAGVGAVTSLLAAAASGAAGPGRFAQVGPDWWSVGPLAGVEVAVVAAATLLVLRPPTTPRLSFGR
jgi:hypothetical protein